MVLSHAADPEVLGIEDPEGTAEILWALGREFPVNASDERRRR